MQSRKEPDISRRRDKAKKVSQAQIHHNRAIAEPASGTAWGPRPIEGSYLQLPPAEGRDSLTRIVVSVHPLDADELPATDVTNALRADLEVTPRVLLTGRS
jgi:hypothetical protein